MACIIVCYVVMSFQFGDEYYGFIYLCLNGLISIYIVATSHETYKVVKKKWRKVDLFTDKVQQGKNQDDNVIKQELERIIVSSPIIVLWITIVNILGYIFILLAFAGIDIADREEISLVMYTIIGTMMQATYGRVSSNSIWNEYMPHFGRIYVNGLCQKLSDCFMFGATKSLNAFVGDQDRKMVVIQAHTAGKKKDQLSTTTATDIVFDNDDNDNVTDVQTHEDL